MKQLPMYDYGRIDCPENMYLSRVNGNQSATAYQPLPDPRNETNNPRKESAGSAVTKANVTEIIIAKDKADSVQLILPMLTHLNQEKRWLAWIDPPIQLLKQWKSMPQNLNTNDIMVIRSTDRKSALDLTEQALEAGTCHAVIVWTKQLSQEAFMKLEHASAKGNSHGIALRYR